MVMIKLKIALWFFSNSQERLGNVTKSGQQISPSSIKLFFIRPNTIFTMWLWIIFRIRYEIPPILWDYCQKCTAQHEESLGEKHHWWIADFNVQTNLFSRPSFYNPSFFSSQRIYPLLAVLTSLWRPVHALPRQDGYGWEVSWTV